MKRSLYAGPFELLVSSADAVKYRDLLKSELKQSHLRFFLSPSEKTLDRLSIRILPAIRALSVPASDCREKRDNWRAWTLADGTTLFQVYSGITGAYATEARISRDFRSIEVAVQEDHPSRNVLEFVLATVSFWVISQLSVQHGGFLLHCASIQAKSGSVFLGCGPSGAGKSTFSRYFWRADGYRLLSDETTMILREKGRFQAYGTPWPGMLSRGLNAGGPLAALFFLEKTPQHEVREIPAREAAVRLLKEIFLPPWSARSTEAVLDAASSLLEQMPCRVLGFQKSTSIVSFLENKV